ncbi:malonate decarboxylase holo-[acyl-carrier-protein] synthase [Massilia brevitalea]|uniref:malonate decarboxylase holo-[acyl-carrier-protein] synthase n=1 Tax=Massilia brevitalea TaxID=442526 RepID=UPI002738BF5B|nr:malonate decarboxylase holo-[acyl-carrier-protein] synthase [Massilia brevitalea]
MFARHDLAWLSVEGWRAVLAAAAADHVPAIAAWQRADRPLVVRRADVGQAPGEVALGLALPPRRADGRKLRIPCRVPASGVRRSIPPLPLAQLVAQLGAQCGAQCVIQCGVQFVAQFVNTLPHWRGALGALEAEAAGQGIALRVYGSAALQVLTGQAYLRDTSDIDLLVQPRDRAQLDAALALLCAYANALPLDGEILFPGARAVAWKEWAAALGSAPGTRVLVKEIKGVSLVAADALRATLQEATCLG